MNKETPVVRLKNVCFSYQDVQVLTGVTFDVYKNESIGIIGPNGGGKTTLLRLLMGFLKPTQGEIEIFGDAPIQMQSKLAYVPQNLQFDKQFPLSLFELVLMGRLNHLPWHGKYSKEDNKLAMEALKKVGLADFKNHAFGKLSGGQMQRGLIARALASQPQILLLDEPTASVDPQAQTDIYELLENLQNVTLLMVTHDLKTAINAVNRIICVQRTTSLFSREDICEHFAMGLYHTPLIQLRDK